MAKIIYVVNPQGIAVKKLCMACRWKAMTRALGMRRCMKNKKDVKPQHCCKNWEMSLTMRLAGKSLGVVRDKDSKEVLF